MDCWETACCNGNMLAASWSVWSAFMAGYTTTRAILSSPEITDSAKRGLKLGYGRPVLAVPRLLSVLVVWHLSRWRQDNGLDLRSIRLSVDIRAWDTAKE